MHIHNCRSFCRRPTEIRGLNKVTLGWNKLVMPCYWTNRKLNNCSLSWYYAVDVYIWCYCSSTGHALEKGIIGDKIPNAKISPWYFLSCHSSHRGHQSNCLRLAALVWCLIGKINSTQMTITINKLVSSDHWCQTILNDDVFLSNSVFYFNNIDYLNQHHSNL